MLTTLYKYQYFLKCSLKTLTISFLSREKFERKMEKHLGLSSKFLHKKLSTNAQHHIY